LMAPSGLSLALAHPLTMVLLGPKWEKAAVIFGGFTIAALCLPLAIVSAWLFTSQGRGRDMFITQVINSIAILISFLIGLPWGPIGVALAYSASNLIVRVPIYYYRAGRSGPVRTSDLWKVFFLHMPIWFVVFTVTWLMLGLTTHFKPILQVLICGPVGLLAGALFIFSFETHRRVVKHLIDTLLELKIGRQ